MIRPREDRWFLRYRRTGDPRLLAKVFDRTADELYAVAAHLCRDRSDAEDGAPVVVPFVARGNVVEVPVALVRSPSVQLTFGPTARRGAEFAIRQNGADVLRVANGEPTRVDLAPSK